MKTQKYNKVPRWYEIPIQSHMLFFIAKSSTYATCYLIELCQIVVILSEIHFILPWSRSHTHFHHICFYTRSKQNFIHPQNKTPCPCITPLSLKKNVKDMGLCKKKNKRCMPKEGMPHASTCLLTAIISHSKLSTSRK